MPRDGIFTTACSETLSTVLVRDSVDAPSQVSESESRNHVDVCSVYVYPDGVAVHSMSSWQHLLYL